MKNIELVKQNLLKTLLFKVGNKEVCECLTSIRATYDILERELYGIKKQNNNKR